MSNLSNYALTINPTSDVVCAYASTPYEPVPTASPAPWVVYGAFSVPQAVSARLVVVGVNSGPAALVVRLYEDGIATSCQAVITSDSDGTVYSAAFAFKANALYQLAARYEGASGSACVRTTSLGAV